MAESTLSMEYKQLFREVGRVLQYGDMPWHRYDADQKQRIEGAIHAGMRRVYFPDRSMHEPNKPNHEWSFLRPKKQITCEVTYATGTIEIASGVVTLTGGTFPTWAATNGSLVVSNSEYSVSVRDSGTQLTLTDTSVTVAAGTAYSLLHDGNYTLPDDYGAMDGPITFDDSTVGRQVVRIASLHEIMDRRSRDLNLEGRPELAAVRPLTTDGTDGQRFELMLWPLPDTAYVLNYHCVILPDALTSASLYPYGGMRIAELIRLAVLAAIIDERNMSMDVRGGRNVYEDRFQQQLSAQIDVDRRANAAEHFGYNRDESDLVHRPATTRYEDQNSRVTFDGVQY